MLLALLAVAIAPAASSAASLAVVSVNTPKGPAEFVSLAGDIEVGDWGKFVRYLRTVPAATGVLLASNGGSLDDGLAIARHVYEHGFATMVTTNCHSACAIIFLAGNDRYLSSDATLSVHSSYKQIGDWVVDDLIANGTVSWFMGRMGYPLALARLWTGTKSADIAPITLEMNTKLKLGFTEIVPRIALKE